MSTNFYFLSIRWIPSIANVFFATKDQWYSIATSYSDPDVGFHHLDSFFKSVSTVMSNQIWFLVEKSLSEFENYFRQFEDASSEVSFFSLNLAGAGAQIRFQPPLTDLEGVIMNILEELVAAVKDLPRVETKLFSSLQGEQLSLPCISIQDERIDEGKYFRKIIQKNAAAPQKHLVTYEKYKSLMTNKAEKRIEDFLRERHDLDDYESVSLFK